MTATTLSLLATLVAGQPSITITAPNGGEVWLAGSTQNIEWTASGVSDVSIRFSEDDGQTWITIADTVDDTSPNWLSYPWSVPTFASSECLIRIQEYISGSPSAVSAGTFEIRYPITIVAPNGGEDWVVGTTQNIVWSTIGVDDVSIELSTDVGTTWDTIVDTIDDTDADWGSYPWLVPDIESTMCVIRIEEYLTGNPFAESMGTFTIRRPALGADPPDEDGGCAATGSGFAALAAVLMLARRRRRRR